MSVRSAGLSAAALLGSKALLSPIALAQSAPPSAEPVEASTAAPLEDQFRDPPNSARPRVWWHWMNGNITKDGIAKDMAWMKRVGIGGLQNFDANLRTPPVVDKRLVYMTPEWKDAFRFAASEADRLNLELAIAASPGWSETGGPWVPPQDGLKKLVWSQTDVTGGRPVGVALARPPGITGPYQSLPAAAGIGAMLSEAATAPPPSYYADVAVLAFPVAGAANLPVPATSTAGGKAIAAQALGDEDLASGVDLAAEAGSPPVLQATYSAAQTVRSATLFAPGSAALFTGARYFPALEASDDGRIWRHIADFSLTLVPTTIAFTPVKALQFRVVFNDAKGGGGGFAAPAPGVDMRAMGMGAMAPAKPIRVTDFRLYGEDRIDQAETKAAFFVAPDYYALDTGLPEVTGVAPDRVIDVTTKLRADGTLDWTPPSGRWRILRLGYSLLGTMNHPAPAEATGLEVDKFDGSAVRRYLEH